MDGAAHDAGPAAQREWMVLRHGPLARHRRHHRYVDKFGQLDELGSGLGVEYALARVDDWTVRVEQRFGGLEYVLRVPLGEGCLDRPVALDYRGVHLLQGDVGRNLDHHGPGSSHLEKRESPTERLGDTARALELLHRLGDRGVAPHGAEMREDAVALARVAKGEKEHRHRVGECGGHSGVGVFGARTVLHSEDAGRSAVQCPAISVGNPDTHTLLAADYRPYTDLSGCLDKWRRGEGAQVFDPFFLENMGNGIDCPHRRDSFLVIRTCRREARAYAARSPRE